MTEQPSAGDARDEWIEAARRTERDVSQEAWRERERTFRVWIQLLAQELGLDVPDTKEIESGYGNWHKN